MSKDSKNKKNSSKGVKNYTKIKLLKQYLSGNTKPSNNEPK